jgi:chemotaxis protein MotB
VTPESASSLPSGTYGAWLVIFTDIVALLLTFFVMIYSMKHLEGEPFDALSRSLSRSLVPSAHIEPAKPKASRNTSIVRSDEAHDLDYLASVIERQLALASSPAAASLIQDGDMLVISLPGPTMLKPDGVTLSAVGEDILFRLGGLLINLANKVEVHGYRAAPAGGRFTSDWEASLAAAVAAANALGRAGYPHAVQAFAGGAARESGEGAPSPSTDRLDVVIRAERSGP